MTKTKKEKKEEAKQGILSLILLAMILLAILVVGRQSFAQRREEGRHPTGLLPFCVSEFATEQLPIPEGIDTPKPRFSWKLSATTHGEKQSAYQILLRDFFSNAVVWDSGKIDSAAQSFIPYTGDDLSPATEYMVELTVWNADGSLTDSITSCFSTGLWPTAADPEPWKAEWIGLDDASDEQAFGDLTKASWIAFENTFELPVGKSVYRRTFEIPAGKRIVRSVANLTGDNRCRIFVNGERVGEVPAFTFAPTIPLTNLTVGKNTLAVEVENGGDAPNPGGALGVVTVFLADNENVEKLEIVTDAEWKAHEGSNEEWFASDFDDSSWKNAPVLASCDAAPWGKITAAASEPESLPARYLAKTVDFPSRETKRVARAVAYIAGLGYYELYLGGEKVGDHLLDPILTDYDKRVAYNTYDVTDWFQYVQRVGAWEDRPLTADEKTDAPSLLVGVILGSGRYYAPRHEVPTATRTYGTPRVLMQIRIEYSDGSTEIVGTDASWKGSTAGPILANNDYDGEIYDASASVPYNPNARDVYLEHRFGQTVAVETTRPVQKMDAPKGKLVAPMMPPMRRLGELKPIAVHEKKPGVWVYDFGQNFVGWCRLAVKGPAQTTVKMRFAETLIPDGPDAGMIYTANLRGALCRDEFTLADSTEPQIYEPRFTYHGFRYVELTGFPGTPDWETLTGCVVGTDLAPVGRFACSDKTISQFVKNIEWGVRGNYLSIPTDCPQRDERQGWQGDRAGEAAGEMFLFDGITLYRKWMQDVEDSQRDDGNVSDVAPAYWPLYGTNVTWPSAMTIIPETIRVMYGDTTAIEKHYDSRKKWLDHVATFIKPDGTLDKDNYGDWCVPPEDPILIHSKDPARQTNRGILATSYYILNLRLMAETAQRLRKADDAAAFFTAAKTMTLAFNKVFYDPQKGRYDNGTQTSCVLPLAFGLVPPGDESKVFDTLVTNIEQVTNRHIGTGLIGGQWLNRVLTDHGRIDLSYTFATNRTYPSWGYMLENGATTVWELWNGNTADPAMNSGNHVMLVGDLTQWYFESLAGIQADPARPGFEHILMKPNPVGDLTWVDAAYDSVRGIVASRWELENGQFVWNVQIPVGSTATVSVPTTNPESVGVMGVSRDDIMPWNFGEKTVEEKRLTFELPSGRWRITAERK